MDRRPEVFAQGRFGLRWLGWGWVVLLVAPSIWWRGPSGIRIEPTRIAAVLLLVIGTVVMWSSDLPSGLRRAWLVPGAVLLLDRTSSALGMHRDRTARRAVALARVAIGVLGIAAAFTAVAIERDPSQRRDGWFMELNGVEVTTRAPLLSGVVFGTAFVVLLVLGIYGCLVHRALARHLDGTAHRSGTEIPRGAPQV